jgi:hypothetical protein
LPYPRRDALRDRSTLLSKIVALALAAARQKFSRTVARLVDLRERNRCSLFGRASVT